MSLDTMFGAPQTSHVLGNSVVFDRPELFMSNLMQGNLSGAGRAITSPESLSPEERKTIAARLGLSPDNPFYKMTEVLTNPLFLTGLLMVGMSKGLPSPARLAGFSGEVKNVTRKLRVLEWLMPTPATVSKETEAIVADVANITDRMHRSLSSKLVAPLEKFRAATGREYLTDYEERIVAALADGLDNPNNQSWTVAKKRLLKSNRPDLAEEIDAFAKNLGNLKHDAPVRQLATDYNAAMQEIFQEHLTDPEAVKHLRATLYKIGGYTRTMADGTLKQGPFVGHLNKEELREILQYFPHVPSNNAADRYQYIRDFVTRNMKESSRVRATAGQAGRVTTRRALDRTGAMLANPEDLRMLGASDKLLEAVGMATSTKADGKPIFYNLHFTRATSRYLHDLSRAWAWGVPPEPGTIPYGQRLQTHIGELAVQGDEGVFKADRLQNEIIPVMLGGVPTRNIPSTLSFMGMKESAVGWLERNGERYLGPKMTARMKTWLRDDESSSLQGMGANIAKVMYMSTLGLPNPVPSMMNLLQPITTLSGLGMEHLGQGINQAAKKMSKYASLRAAGYSKERALQEAMPDFIEHVHITGPIGEDTLTSFMEGASESILGMPKSVRASAKKLGDASMSLFSHTEMFNRLVAYETGLVKGAAELPGNRWYFVRSGRMVEALPDKNHPETQQAIKEFARSLVSITQFEGGPMGRPSITRNLWAPLAQFTGYPLRLAGLLGNQMASNPGYLGQTLLYSGLAQGVAQQAFGTDISRGLLLGGIPQVSDTGPFAPMPVVPPLMQLLGGAGLAAAGDSSELRKSLPLLVPGGIGLSKLAGIVPGGSSVATFLGRPHADYDNPLPDGRVGVYSPDGRLQTYARPTQLVANAMGFPSPSMSVESTLTKYIMAQRDSIRGIKREYLDALYVNDPDKARSIAEEYERQYPGMGGIPVTKSDISALHMRRDVTRIERLLQTLPEELRPQFQAVVATAFGNQYPAVLGLTGAGLSAGTTINAREDVRQRTRGDTQSRLTPSMHGVKLNDRMRMGGFQDRDAPTTFYPEGDGMTGPYR